MIQAYHHAGYQCYACTIDITGYYRNKSEMDSTFGMYENVVEYIEALPRDATFSRVSIWRALGQGYKEYSLTYHAIRDMYAHKIIECARRGGRTRCLEYRVRRDLDLGRETCQGSRHGKGKKDSYQ